MSIFNTPPSTTDPLKLLQYFQEKRDASKGGVNGIMSDSNSNTDVDDFVASYHDALNNRRVEAMNAVEQQKSDVLASYTAPASASNDDTLMASLESQSEVEKLLRGILRNKRKKTESYGEVNDSVTDSTNIPGINATPTVSDSAGKVVEGPPYNVERMIEINNPVDSGNGIMSSLRPKARPEVSEPTISSSNPINVRNNNLGNIKNISSNKWKGQTNLKTKETFASFSSPELGVRALKKVIQVNINKTSTIEEYVNRYASEPDEKAHFKKTGSLLPHLKNYALVVAKSQGLKSEKDKIPKKVNMLEWIKATARAEGGEGALKYFTDDVINAGIKL